MIAKAESGMLIAEFEGQLIRVRSDAERMNLEYAGAVIHQVQHTADQVLMDDADFERAARVHDGLCELQRQRDDVPELAGLIYDMQQLLRPWMAVRETEGQGRDD